MAAPKKSAKASRKRASKAVPRNSASAKQNEALQALADLRANSSWTCLAPDGMDDRDRLLPDRSKRNQRHPARVDGNGGVMNV
jgi:hypothetical protein